jgi:hypothetical protein
VALPPKRVIRVAGELPPSAIGGLLAVCLEATLDTFAYMLPHLAASLAIQGWVADETVVCRTAVPERSMALSWQTWRVAVSPGEAPRPFVFEITAMLPERVATACQAYFLPGLPADPPWSA